MTHEEKYGEAIFEAGGINMLNEKALFASFDIIMDSPKQTE